MTLELVLTHFMLRNPPHGTAQRLIDPGQRSGGWTMPDPLTTMIHTMTLRGRILSEEAWLGEPGSVPQKASLARTLRSLRLSECAMGVTKSTRDA